MLIERWVSGSEVEDGRWDNRGSRPRPVEALSYERAWALLVMIVLGVLLVLSLLAVRLLGGGLGG